VDKVHEPHPIGEVVEGFIQDPKGKPGLPHTSRPGERQESYWWGEQDAAHVLYFPFAAHEAGKGNGNVVSLDRGSLGLEGTRSRLEAFARLASQAQGIREDLHGLTPGGVMLAEFKPSKTTHADIGALSELFLSEPGVTPEAPQQFGERGQIRGHSALLSNPQEHVAQDDSTAMPNRHREVAG
jgi:hypothetical protein